MLMFLTVPGAASAGAWLQPQGDGQVIATVIYSGAGTGYDANSRADQPASFHKLWSSIWAEYGLAKKLTLIFTPEYAHATTRDTSGYETRASDFAWGLGLRWRITDAFGTLSLQALAKSAGAFDMSVSVNDQAGKQGELRLLYGTNFTLFHHNGFLDVEAGERWIAGARPDETVADFTLGYHILRHDMVMLQSFNTVSGGDARAPYVYYRAHKLELSWVTEFRHGVSLQSGTYFSPAGQNSLDEKGAQVSLWVNF